LRRWIGVPFWLAALISSLLFGAAHFSQGSTLAESLAAMGITMAGGFLFCWAAERWQSLWLGITMHIGLNVVWALFSAGDNAVGGMAGNIARLAAVVVALGGTLVLTRRQRTA
jgi:membrane protease YdiL (CAAX protease family)